MLQQTQVARVLGFYGVFLKKFPNFKKLAKAPLREVLSAWKGLGYNRRAVNLKLLAGIVVAQYGGRPPLETEKLCELPGIGEGTAGAIVAFAYNQPAVFIETNIRRVFLHCFFLQRKNVHDKELLPLIKETLDKKNPREWYYALMDYGAMLGVKEKMNPNRRSAHYKKQSVFNGSVRKLRGEILLELLKHHKGVVHSTLMRNVSGTREKKSTALAALIHEKIVIKKAGKVAIAQ